MLKEVCSQLVVAIAQGLHDRTSPDNILWLFHACPLPFLAALFACFYALAAASAAAFACSVHNTD
jgi:hypothetical protein